MRAYMACIMTAAVGLASSPWSQHHIAALNHTLRGKVRTLHPFAKPCFSTYQGAPVMPDPVGCGAVQANYASPSFRARFPGAYMYEESSICASNDSSTDQCLLNPEDPRDQRAFANTSCNQGNLPSYYINVQEPNDVIQAFRFAERSGAHLVVKNSGHSFQGDSSTKGALMLWTRNLKHLSRSTHFVPRGCPEHEGHFDALTAGAGINCGEAYDFADKNNATVLCAYSPTVGLSGGFLQSGGHSVLSPAFGLAADRVLEFAVVTPDGRFRVANRCRNRDLFWALRGGGGGTFGVVLESTHMVEPRIPIALASIQVDAENRSAVTGFMHTLVDATLGLASDGWGGHIYGNRIVYVNPLIRHQECAEKSMSRMIEYAKRNGGVANVTVEDSFSAVYERFVVRDAAKVGVSTLINTRLVPASVFGSRTLKRTLKKHIAVFVHAGGLPYVPVSGPYLYRGAAGATSVNPAWRTALWEYGNAASWTWNSTLAERMAVVQGMQRQHDELLALTPGGGAYRNEAYPFNANWRVDNFGAPYERLLAVKKKYDPRRLLKCRNCVGWRDEDEQSSCYRSFHRIKA
ncbi:hypothetical protein E4U42_005802 [Claviceps africana]|uniref:FAD-binding PCMH-type domain-containing protein n=1 Tax=Claviceps africana TaxID=83212 RepID=A0A8K0NH44_9HYPO|nr:hypothetical protein E4U42_005802 [Claviceps africana]